MKKILMVLGGIATVSLVVFYFIYQPTLIRKYEADERKNWEMRDREIERLKTKISKLMKDIQKYGGDGRCKDHVDCKAVGLGAKTCDGYRTFYHYSSLAMVDEVEFFSAVRSYNLSDDRINKLQYKVPSCGAKYLESVCLAGRCGPKP